MAEIQFKAWVEFGDGIFAQLVSISPSYLEWDGARVRDVIFYVPEETLELLGIVIDEEGVSETGKGRGNFLKRTYPNNYIREGFTTYSEGRAVPLVRVLCTFNGDESELTRLGEGRMEYEQQLERRIEVMKGQVAALGLENKNLRSQLKEILKQHKEYMEVMDSKGDEGEEAESKE